MIRKILRRFISVFTFLMPLIAVLLALLVALATIQQPTRLNIVVLISLALAIVWIIYTFIFLKKEKCLSDERIKQDRIRQEKFFKELEKIAGKEIADQFRCY